VARAAYQVKPDGDQWRVMRRGARRASSIHPSKAQATARAKELAKRGPNGQVRVHGRDGSIRHEWTYGEAPRVWLGR
jgi:hypothetical protein